MDKNEIVLNYGESLLRQADVDLLRGPYWLNDTIISFYFEYLEKEAFSSHKSVLFISPEVTQCIKLSPQNEIPIFLDPLVKNEQREFIFLALNDNEMSESTGGSHWSLLVVSIPELTIFHFDSSQGSNFRPASELGIKLVNYFSFPSNRSVENVPSLQQSNGFDCGIHVLCNAEVLASHAIHYKTIKTCPRLSHEAVKIKRKEILGIIEQLKKRMGNT